MFDRRNRGVLLGAVIGGIVAFLVLWWLGLPLLVSWVAGWTLPAFALYGLDKRQAGQGGRRVPEAVLHGLALIGGVMGAWTGRAVFRHKTQKPVFLIVLIAASVLWAGIAAWPLLG